MTKHKALLLASFGSAMFILSDMAFSATLPPPPADPALAALFADATQALGQLSTPGYFDVPGTSAEWPCAVDEHTLRAWAQALGTDETTDKDRRNYIRSLRDIGMEDGKQVVRNVKIAPLVAQCKDGKLDGKVEYWVENFRDIHLSTLTHSTREQRRVRVTVLSGELSPTEPRFITQRDFQRVMKMNDPNIQKFLDKNGPDKSETHSVMGVNPDLSNVTIIDSGDRASAAATMVVYNAATGPGRQEGRVFMDGQLFTVMHSKDGRLHGSYETFPVQFPGSLAPPPAVKKCYENGEEIKVATCSVD